MIDFVDLDGRIHLVHDASVRSRIRSIRVCPDKPSVHLVLFDGGRLDIVLGRADVESIMAAQTALVVPIGGAGAFAAYEVPISVVAGLVAVAS